MQKPIREKEAGQSSDVERSVILRCSIPGCPRKLKIPWDDTMPEGTKTIVSKCPWHAKNGEFDSEIYLDGEGEQLAI